MVNDKGFKAALLKKLNEVGRENDLKGFELAKSIHVDLKSFAEQGLTTGTMKMLRNEVKKNY